MRPPPPHCSVQYSYSVTICHPHPIPLLTPPVAPRPDHSPNWKSNFGTLCRCYYFTTMPTPLFVYLVPETAWHVIVTDDGGHFYFNSLTKSSVWQLADVADAGIADRINYDDLAVLFGKARGLSVRRKKERKPDKRSEDNEAGDYKTAVDDEQVDDVVESPEADDSESESDEASHTVENQLDTMELLRSVMEENNVVVEPLEEDSEEDSEDNAPVDAGPDEKSDKMDSATGLALGYSSSEDESDEEPEEQPEKSEQPENSEQTEQTENTDKILENPVLQEQQDDQDDQEQQDEQEQQLEGQEQSDDNAESPNTQLDLDLDLLDHSGLDLSLGPDTVSQADAEAFADLLDAHKDEISIYDPWFMVEEQLLPKIATSPAYYAVLDERAREDLFNAWVARNSEQPDNAGGPTHSLAKYPTSELVFFQFLQNHKTDVRKMFFPEFLRVHGSELAPILDQHLQIDPEALYRQLRVMLVDFAKFERQNKSRDRSVNLKVVHVQKFVLKLLPRSATPGPGPGAASGTGVEQETSPFDQWIHLLNHHNVPETVAHDATNFLLGDEKRLACYLQALDDSRP